MLERGPTPSLITVALVMGVGEPAASQSMFKAAVGVPEPCPRDCPSQLCYPLQVTKLFLSTGNSCVCLGGWVLTSIEGQRPVYAVSAIAWGSQLPRDPALGV